MRFSFVLLARALYLLAISYAGLSGRWEAAMMHFLIFLGSLVLPWLGRKDGRYYALDVYAVAVFTLAVLVTDWSGGLDKLFHLLGGAGAGWFALIFFRNAGIVHAVLAAAVIGLLWEGYELFLVTLPEPFSVPHGGLPDSMLDLLVDVLGGGLAAVQRYFK